MGLATCQVQRLPFKPFLVRLGLVKTTRQNHSEKLPPVTERQHATSQTSQGERKPTFCVPALWRLHRSKQSSIQLQQVPFTGVPLEGTLVEDPACPTLRQQERNPRAMALKMGTGGGEPSCPPVSKNVLVNMAMRQSYQRSKDSKTATLSLWFPSPLLASSQGGDSGTGCVDLRCLNTFTCERL